MTAAPLAVTMGDPAGIGPEIIAKAWAALRKEGPAFLVVGDHDLLAAAGAGSLRRIASPDDAARIFPDALPVLDIPISTPVVSGKPSAAHAPAASIITGPCGEGWSRTRVSSPRNSVWPGKGKPAS